MKKIRLKKLMEYIRERRRLVIALFYGDDCPSCDDQEKELKRLEKEVEKYGVTFVKLDIAKFRRDMRKKPSNAPKLKIDAIPTVMMWARGLTVGFEFEPNGKQYTQLNGFTEVSTFDFLYPRVMGLLQAYS